MNPNRLVELLIHVALIVLAIVFFARLLFAR